MTLQSETAPTSGDPVARAAPRPRRSHVGAIVVGSLFAGLVAALILPFIPAGTVDVDFSTAHGAYRTGVQAARDVMKVLAGRSPHGADA